MQAHINLSFIREDVSDKRKSIKSIVSLLPVKPDKVWVKDTKTHGEYGVTFDEDGFSYKFKFKTPAYENDNCFFEGCFNNLLEKVLYSKLDIDKHLIDYRVKLYIALYTDGMVNPSFCLNKEAIKLLNYFNSDFEVDVYLTPKQKQSPKLRKQ